MPMRLRGGDRKYCIAGNWKMNPASLDDAKKLATDVRLLHLCRCDCCIVRACKLIVSPLCHVFLYPCEVPPCWRCVRACPTRRQR
jgi:hypothetical protein